MERIGPLRTDNAISGTTSEGNMPVNIFFVYLFALLSESSPKVGWSFYFETLSDNNFTGDLPSFINESRSTQIIPKLRLTLSDQLKSVLADFYCPSVNELTALLMGNTWRPVDDSYDPINLRQNKLLFPVLVIALMTWADKTCYGPTWRKY